MTVYIGTISDLRKLAKTKVPSNDFTRKEIKPVIDRTELLPDDAIVQVWRLRLDNDDRLEWSPLT